MVSASSWSLIEGSEIFFTITECPLTAVATALVLIWLSRNSFEIALDTVPESTIMESTTMSDDSGSRPRCATSICPPFFFSSTALMLEEPTSRPTIDFDPNPNMCPPLSVARAFCPRRFTKLCPAAFAAAFGLRFACRFHLARLLFHPLIQPRFLEAPAVAQLERGNLLFADVLVQSVRTHAQILRRLANIHHFSRVGHSSFASLHRILPVRSPAAAGIAWETASPSTIGSEGFRCPEHISAPKNPGSKRISAFCRVFYLFSGIEEMARQSGNLYIVVACSWTLLDGLSART